MEKKVKKEEKASVCQLELFAPLDTLPPQTSNACLTNYVAPVIHLQSYIRADKVDQFYERVGQLTSHLKEM